MHWLWLAVAVVAAAPLAYVGFLLNPLVFFALGSEEWQTQMHRLRPYRWWLAFAVTVCGLAIAMFVLSG
jgi:hypothetical protein